MAGEESHLAEPGSFEFYLNAGLALGCVCLAALAAGLTMGMVAIEGFRLQILLETKEEDCTSKRQVEELRSEKACAAKLLPIVSKHHLLLVTLLLLNSVANECLPLFLDEVVPTYIAIILSVTFVLLFGEIIPSAIFTGPNQLHIAASFVPVVRVAMFLLYPIAYPVSRILDRVLGADDHADKFNKAELRALVKLHASHNHHHHHKPSPTMAMALSKRNDSHAIKVKLTEIGVDERTAAMAAMATAAAQEAIEEEEEDFLNLATGATNAMKGHVRAVRTESAGTQGTDAGLEVDEILIMHGALDLKETTAEDKMIPLMHVYMLSTDEFLTEARLADLVAAGHSRIPVYENERTNIRGLLLVKKLIVINPTDERRVDTLYLRMPVFVKPGTSLLELLNEFQKGSSHMAIVTDNPRTMEKCIKLGKAIPDDINVYGICTLEDIMETLIKEEISDETDFELSVKQSLFTQQRKQRLIALADKQKKSARKLALSGVAALVGAKK
uniref:CNNM transmembrane domain-containing protein n=1 Tax=Mucochytrium quahogii TaxID=96639 RepID=A0A7S2WRZ5_9STRA|mmetsp:Transcript_4721/g.7108  ORF Transcript_4721/g.7108 Transcript_4721/m.7108 type:complete len:500 (+) Transcript_4721:165-1664(+)